MTTWPTLSRGQDERQFGIDYEDVTMASEMEGGYVITRPRHTRRPRRTWKTGFTEMTDADRVAWESFFDSVRGGSLSFEWPNPIDGQNYTVRLKSGETPSLEYVGRGGVHFWNIRNITLEEV